MIYSGKEVLEKYGTRYNLSKALKNKEIFKLEHGIYSDKDLVNPMIIASKKYSSAIITMDSALYNYDLTDVIPKKTYVATNRNSNNINDEKIVQIKVPKDVLNYGKEEVIVDGEKVKMYNRERFTERIKFIPSYNLITNMQIKSVSLCVIFINIPSKTCQHSQEAIISPLPTDPYGRWQQSG